MEVSPIQVPEVVVIDGDQYRLYVELMDDGEWNACYCKGRRRRASDYIAWANDFSKIKVKEKLWHIVRKVAKIPNQ